MSSSTEDGFKPTEDLTDSTATLTQSGYLRDHSSGSHPSTDTGHGTQPPSPSAHKGKEAASDGQSALGNSGTASGDHFNPDEFHFSHALAGESKESLDRYSLSEEQRAEIEMIRQKRQSEVPDNSSQAQGAGN
jgi:hypothetical protein